VNAQAVGIRSPYLVLAVFLAPTLIGVPGMFVWQRWCRRKFAEKGMISEEQESPVRH
jgi:hypothetical protein